MAINKLWIEEGCIVCGVCEATAPEVFEMNEDTAFVKKGVNFAEYEVEILESAENCPVEVIKYE
jgi:ferredoxin